MFVCFFVKELQVVWIADLEECGGGEECNQIFLNLKNSLNGKNIIENIYKYYELKINI